MTTTATRRSFTIELTPHPTPRFQPTGFPDLGPATYEAWVDNEWVRCILVESPQSMANRLEAVGWIADGDNSRPHPALDSLPYVRVEDEDGDFLASSRTEAHRLASAYVLDAVENGTPMRERLAEELGLEQDRPLDLADIARRVFAIDPLCLLHGVFFAQKAWVAQPKIARAVTATIDAIDVKEAHSGGVKFDQVSNRVQEGSGTAEGYGTVPHHRTEFTAREVLLRYSLDLGQLQSYRLSDDATELLQTIALWQLASLLERGLRLRTACEFDAVRIADESGNDTALDSVETLASRIEELAAVAPELQGVEPVRTVVWSRKKKK